MLTVAQILKQTRLVTCFTSPTIFETSASGARALGVTYRGLGSIAGRTTKGWMADRVSVSPFIYHANSRECTKMAMHTELSNAGRLLVRRGAAIPLCTALLATASLASVCERDTKAGSVIGAPLLCFGVFSILSNLHLVPATHKVYDICWSFLLPLSLSVIILGNPAVARGRSSQAIAIGKAEGSLQSVGPLARVGLAFMIGMIGSLVGVAMAFRVATSSTGAFALPQETAAQVAGAVAATYIGGSVNLFAVAAATGLRQTMTTSGASVLGALAASDIFLMAIYFSGLFAARKTPLLRHAFPTTSCERRPSRRGISAVNKDSPCERDHGSISLRCTLPTTLRMLTLGSAICVLGNVLASISPLPGTLTISVALLTVIAAHLISKTAPRIHAELLRTTPGVAMLLLNIFFGSVGASGRWAQVVGVAPAIFAFTSLALAVHVVIITVGTALLNQCFRVNVDIDDIVVASNANIGGPSTAATFAGLIGRDQLVVPAAIWGTVGYATATTLGVGIWNVLR